MSFENTINATERTNAGKGAARAVRRTGLIPAVIYGENLAPVLIALNPKEILKPLHRGVVQSTLFHIIVGDKRIDAVVRDVQLDPLSENPIHIDFQRVNVDGAVHVWVAVRFLNTEICPGIKLGGSLTVVRPAVELVCPPRSIPERLNIDLSTYKIGSSIKISAFALPDGVKPAIQGRDFVVATISIPKGMTAEESKGEAPKAAAAPAKKKK